MYKGKFDQKNKQSSADVQDLLSQRNSAPSRPAQQPAPDRGASDAAARKEDAASGKAAGRETGASAKSPARAAQQPTKTQQSKAQPAGKSTASQSPARPAKRGPRLGGVIFYTLYFMFILVFFIGTFIGLLWLKGWLTDYELAQPSAKAEQVFIELFTDPQWGELYEASGAQDSLYEGEEEFVAYMTEKVGSSQLTYLETSAGLSGDKKYVVRLGSENIASFTLVDKNSVGDTTLDNLGDLPDWQLGAVEVYFQRENSYLINSVSGHTVYVNNVALDDSSIIQIATTKAAEYLPEGTVGVSMCLRQAAGLFMQPTVTIFDDKGNQMEVTYDESTCTFTERTESNTISDEEQEAVRLAAETNCLWMITEITNRATVAKYFDSSSDAYSDIVGIPASELWMQSNNGYSFVDESITDYCQYTDELFSARISLTLNVTRTDSTVKGYPYERSMFFHKNDSGSWVCFIATNVDISKPVGKVRLTFMQGETLLTSDFYETDASEIITPIITPVPQGQVFSGWVTVSEDDSGSTVYTLMFVPDSTGRVSIPEGTTLEPMTLYALFEDADAAAAVPQTTEGE